MSEKFIKCFFAAILGSLMALPCVARDVSITVATVDNKPLADAVVYVDATDMVPVKNSPLEIMDQQRKTFVPHVLAIPAGTLVDFPNTDSVNHYVYSFSEVKKFQFKLFKSDLEKHQMLFDKPGLVTIGCNIHDYMLGYIFVAPSPYVGVSNAEGKIHLKMPEKGNFTLAIWHESSNENLDALEHTISMDNPPTQVEIRFTKALKPQRRMSHDGEDY